MSGTNQAIKGKVIVLFVFLLGFTLLLSACASSSATSPTSSNTNTVNKPTPIPAPPLKELYSTPSFSGHSGVVTGVAISPDNSTIASVGYDQTLRLWDAVSGNKIHAFQDVEAFLSVTFSPDGKTIATSSESGKICLWDTITGKLKATLEGLKEAVFTLAFSPDGKNIIAGDYDNDIILWEVATQKQLKVFTGHEHPIRKLGFSPDGKTLFSYDYDSNIFVWDVDTTNKIRAFQFGKTEQRIAAFSPSGKYAAVVEQGFTVKIIDTNSGKEVSNYKSPDIAIANLIFTPDNKKLFIGFGNGNLKYFDFTAGNQAEDYPSSYSEWIFTLAISHDGKMLVAGGGAIENSVIIWDVTNKNQLRTIKGHDRKIQTLAINQTGSLVAIANLTKIRLWEVSSQKEIALLQGQFGGIYSLKFSPDGKYLASAAYDKTVKLWDVKNQKLLETFVDNSSEYPYMTFAFTQDGKLITSQESNKIKVFDLQTLKQVRSMTSQVKYIYSIDSNLNADKIVVAGYNNFLEVLDINTGQTVQKIDLSNRTYLKVAFTGLGLLIATFSNYTYDIELMPSGANLDSYPLSGHSNWIFQMAATPGCCSKIASASIDGEIIIWKLTTSLFSPANRQMDKGLTALDISSDGKLLVTGHWDGSLKFWEVD
jgi:WD40 repeat protein